MKKALQREIEVAFSKHAQPVWFRIAKWIVFLSVLYLLWGTKYIWWVIAGLVLVALSVHFFYRYKTKGWTKSYGLWNYEINKPKKGAE
jgi:hypothetical protein